MPGALRRKWWLWRRQLDGSPPNPGVKLPLEPSDRELGALVIDFGGGTTDYILFRDGSVGQCGVLAVGGDHITNDISIGLRVPIN
jgi:cell division ATPase FtsA